MPAITTETLDSQLKTGQPSAVYLLVGDDAVAIDRAVDAIECVVDEADRAFAVERRYAGEPGGSPIDIATSARMVPMLGDRRVIVVLRAERLFKPKRAGTAVVEDDEAADGESGEGSLAVDSEALEEYFASPVASTVLVFVASEIDRGRRLTKRALERATLIECKGLKADARDPRGAQREAEAVVQRTVEAAGRTIAKEAARILAMRTGGDITKLRHDVDKVVLYAGERTSLTLEDVLEVVSDPNAVADDWAVVNQIAEGDVAKALIETGKRFDRGDSAHALVGQLRWWVSNRLAQSEPGRVRHALEAILRTDLALKSSGGDERVLVERLIVELTRTR